MLVAQAMADYVDYLQTSGRESAAVTAARAGRSHILPQLGAVPVQALTTDQLRHWLAALANRLAKRNGHEDALRRSRATANRILGTLRAALNHAYAECRVPSDNTWRGRLKPFRNVAVARKRYLTVPRHSGCSMQRRVACATWCKQHYRPVRVTANSRGSRCMTLMLPAGPWALPSPRLADQGAFSLPRKAPYFFTASPLVAAAMNSCCGTTAASHGGARIIGGLRTTPLSGPSWTRRSASTACATPMPAWH